MAMVLVVTSLNMQPAVGVPLGHVEPDDEGFRSVGAQFPGEPGLVVMRVDGSCAKPSRVVAKSIASTK